MWTSTIERKDFSNGNFRVFVKYTDGTNSFEESYNLSNKDSLDRTIRNKIHQLEDVAAFSETVLEGEYTPPQEIKPTPTAYDLALQEVTRVKTLVSLGVLQETDPEFVTAIAALKAEYVKL